MDFRIGTTLLINISCIKVLLNINQLVKLCQTEELKIKINGLQLKLNLNQDI